MSGALAAQLIAQYGLPFVIQLVQQIESGRDVTSADLQKLDEVASQNAQYHLQKAAQAANLSMTDPKVVALAQLIAAAGK